jgi:hypothetical protein
LSQFESTPEPGQQASTAHEPDELDDPLIELLRRGVSLQQNDFLTELRRQRSGEFVAI